MTELKKFDDIKGEDYELSGRRSKLLKNTVIDFYQTIKNHPNVLTQTEVYILSDKISFFGTSIWENKIEKDRRHRELFPVIFGLKSGIVFKEENIIFFDGNEHEDYWDMRIHSIHKYLQFEGNKIKNNYRNNKSSNQEDIAILNDFITIIKNLKNKFDKEIENEIIKQKAEIINQKEKLSNYKDILIKKFDKDSDGHIDLIENDFIKLLNKNQKHILEIDRNYIHQFVKVSNYIKTKRLNIQNIFETIVKSKNQNELNERVSLLKNQIHSYDLLVFHSINMIGSLVSEDLITFYEIYESFDKLGMFNSNWENEVSEKLINIGNKLDDLMYSIYEMEQNIVSELSNLSYITQESFKELNQSITSQLMHIDSSININNLLTGIQTYQLYKINKNTKSIRS